MQDQRKAWMAGRTSEGGVVVRPLSPHLQIYRPQITSVLSIFHRIAGLGLGVGTLLLVAWLAALAGGPASFAAVQAFLASIIGKILLFLWTVALAFHLFNGIRHLAWDLDLGFGTFIEPVISKGRPIYHASGWAVVAVTIAAIVAIWVVGVLVR